jgi:hypothetical protein
MAFTHTIRRIYSTNAGVIVDMSEAVSGTQQGVDIDTTISPGVQTEFDVMVVIANVQSILIFCDQPAEILTNDPAAPSSTIPIKANIPLIWTLNSFWSLPFAGGTINKIYVTNNGASAGALKIRMLSN